MIRAVKHFPRDIVPQFIQRTEDGFKSPPFVMRQQAGNIFKEQILRSFNGGNSGNFKEESSSCILESSPLSSDRKALARKSSANTVEIRQGFGLDISRIFEVHLLSGVV